MERKRRTGLCMRKMGMMRLFSEHGEHIPVTMLHLESCHVLEIKNKEAHGYDALRLGFGALKEQKLNKPMKGTYKAWLDKGLAPPRFSREFKISSDEVIEMGEKISVAHFMEGQKVDVRAKSKGRGFSGVIKRHNFAGLAASHGVSISHRSHGSTGHSQDPGRVFKGKKMAGHYGDAWHTIQNLEIVKINEEDSVILVKGAVPGARGGIVEIYDAIKHPVPEQTPPESNESNEIQENNEQSEGETS